MQERDGPRDVNNVPARDASSAPETSSPDDDLIPFTEPVLQYALSLARSRIYHRENAEDVGREALLRMQEDFLRGERPTKAPSDPDHPFEPYYRWLSGYFRRVLLEYFREQKRLPEFATDTLEADSESSSIQHWKDNVTQLETRDEVYVMLGQLSDSDSELIFLRYWHGLSNRDIADQLGEKENTISHRIVRILRQLREMLTRENINE